MCTNSQLQLKRKIFLTFCEVLQRKSDWPVHKLARYQIGRLVSIIHRRTTVLSVFANNLDRITFLGFCTRKIVNGSAFVLFFARMSVRLTIPFQSVTLWSLVETY